MNAALSALVDFGGEKVTLFALAYRLRMMALPWSDIHLGCQLRSEQPLPGLSVFRNAMRAYMKRRYNDRAKPKAPPRQRIGWDKPCERLLGSCTPAEYARQLRAAGHSWPEVAAAVQEAIGLPVTRKSVDEALRRIAAREVAEQWSG